MAHFENFPALLADLDRRGLFHAELGLERMRMALAALGLESAPFFMAQILGTNGKGSTATFLDSLGRAHGLKCGLYTSPHFLSPTERILVDGKEAKEDEWLAAVNMIMEAAPCASTLTYFELLTLAAILIFKNSGIDLAVIEAGLGGKNDATSALPVSLHLFAPIDIDHAAIIGPDLLAIAKDKAGAIKSGSAVFSAPQTEIPREILCGTALASGAPAVFARPMPPHAQLGLAGSQQRINAGLALAAFRHILKQFGISPDAESIAAGLKNAFIPGRLQWARPGLLLDGGHNPHALGVILPEAKKMLGSDIRIIFAALKDKDWPQMIALLQRHFPSAGYIVPALANPRAANAAELAAELNRRIPGSAAATENTAAALAAAGNAPTLAIGSLYLLSEIYSLHPHYLARRQTNAR